MLQGSVPNKSKAPKLGKSLKPSQLSKRSVGSRPKRAIVSRVSPIAITTSTSLFTSPMRSPSTASTAFTAFTHTVPRQTLSPLFDQRGLFNHQSRQTPDLTFSPTSPTTDLHLSYNDNCPALFNSMNVFAQTNDISTVLQNGLVQLQALSPQSPSLVDDFATILRQVDTSFDKIPPVLVKSLQLITFGRGVSPVNPILHDRFILSSISMMYMAKMLDHILPLADENSPKVTQFKESYPALVKLSQVSAQYIQACVELQGPDFVHTIVIPRALSLVASPGIGKSKWLHVAAYFGFELGIPVDVISSNSNIYNFHSFEPNQATPVKYLPPVTLPKVISLIQDPAFFSQNELSIAEMTKAHHFVKSRLSLGDKRLIILDPLEYNYSSGSANPTSYFATTISPLFHDSVAKCWVGENETPQSYYNFLPSSFQDRPESKSRLISTSSCPNHFTAPIYASHKNDPIYTFNRNSPLMIPLPNVYTHQQISAIFSSGNVPNVKNLDLIPRYCPPSIRPVLEFLSLSPEAFEALLAWDFTSAPPAVRDQNGQINKPLPSLAHVSNSKSNSKLFPFRFFQNTISTTYSYPLRRSISYSPPFTQYSDSATLFDRFISYPRYSLERNEEDKFWDAVQGGVLSPCLSPGFYVPTQLSLSQTEPSPQAESPQIKSPPQTESLQKKTNTKHALPFFDPSNGNWVKIEHIYQVKSQAYCLIGTNAETQMKNVCNELITQPYGTMIRFPADFPTADFCFRIQRGDLDHYHLIHFSNKTTSKYCYKTFMTLFKKALAKNKFSLTFADYIPSRHPKDSLSFDNHSRCIHYESFDQLFISQEDVLQKKMHSTKVPPSTPTLSSIELFRSLTKAQLQDRLTKAGAIGWNKNTRKDELVDMLLDEELTQLQSVLVNADTKPEE